MPSHARKEMCAIFVHAGAGYHSIENEPWHLAACHDACVAAMAILRSGGRAVEAVEAAIMVLEDNEITNAGFGSNLTVDGIVEGDATVVDHLGMSGAVGAVAQIKNPISLARSVLDHNYHLLSLHRAPPNLLVGVGATIFASEVGIPILPFDAIVSPSAKARWKRWTYDLWLHENPSKGLTKRTAARLLDMSENRQDDDDKERSRQGHTSLMQYEVQADSRKSTGGLQTPDRSPPALSQSAPYIAAQDGSTADSSLPLHDKEDCITDTVGAIAVDMYGHIAAGSSSGGIGMKHRGRVGPAALVNTGTAVIPMLEDDPDELTTATVGSGTGEHMSSTQIALAASQRLYGAFGEYNQGVRACWNSKQSEDEILRDIVETDFMQHPSVKYSPAQAALGLLSLKRDKRGIWIYFAHNTESFAMASMLEQDTAPKVHMSRGGNGRVVVGGRSARRYKN